MVLVDMHAMLTALTDASETSGVKMVMLKTPCYRKYILQQYFYAVLALLADALEDLFWRRCVSVTNDNVSNPSSSAIVMAANAQ